jgi:MFS family permease
MGTGGYVFPVFLIPVTEELGWSRTTYALANPIMSTSVALIGPLVGWLSDRRGPRGVLVAGSLLMSVSLMAAGRMQTPTQFYVIALGIGIAVACLGDLPTGAAIAGRFRERRGVALSLVYIGSNIGGALVPLVGMALATGASWRTALTGIGGALWIMLLPLALSVNAPPGHAASDGESDDGSRGATRSASATSGSSSGCCSLSISTAWGSTRTSSPFSATSATRAWRPPAASASRWRSASSASCSPAQSPTAWARAPPCSPTSR